MTYDVNITEENLTINVEGNVGGGGGVTDHTALTNIGTNTHDQIDTHIANVNLFHAYDSTGGTTISNVAPTDIPFDTENRKDSNYTHDIVTNNHEITINATGEYKITFDVTATTTSAGTRNESWYNMEKDTGGGFVVVGGTSCALYHRQSIQGRTTGTVTTIQTLTVGDKIKFTGQADLTLVELVIDGTRITIERID